MNSRKSRFKSLSSRYIVSLLIIMLMAMTILAPNALAASADVQVSPVIVDVTYDGETDAVVGSYFGDLKTKNQSLNYLKYVENNSADVLKIVAFYAVYSKSNNKLAKLGSEAFEIPANTKKFIALTGIDLAEYPATGYTYKIFCWGLDFVPFIKAFAE